MRLFLCLSLLIPYYVFSQDTSKVVYFEDLQLNELDSIDNKLKLNTLIRLWGNPDKIKKTFKRSRHWVQPYAGKPIRPCVTEFDIYYKKYNAHIILRFHYKCEKSILYTKAWEVDLIMFEKSKPVSKSGFSFTDSEEKSLSGEVKKQKFHFYFDKGKLESVKFIPSSW